MEQKSAVLLVANFSNDTGYAWRNIYRLFNSIARTFREKNMNVCISFAEIKEHVDIIDSDIQVKSLVFNPYEINLLSLVAFRRSIKRHNIKYVYFTDMRSWHWLYVLLKLWGVKKIIVHCRISVESPYPAMPETGLKKCIKLFLNSIPILRADYMYAISEFVGERLINKNCYPKQRVIKILNGIDVDKYMCAEATVVRDEVVIFCCARATKHKGIVILIEAARILKDKYKLENYCIQYAGSGPDLEGFKKLTVNLDINEKFVFLGQLDSTHEFACNSDIIVVPSVWGEGFGSTVAEGMAAGKAVVATTAGGIPEVVGGPEFGVLVTPGDSSVLADALNRLIKDGEIRRQLGKRAKERARKCFSEVRYHELVTKRMLLDFEI